MIFTQALRMALKAIGGNKMRSILTVLGIIIGVMAVVVLVSLAQGASDKVTGSIQELGSNLLVVNVVSNRDIPLNTGELKAMEGTNGIRRIAPTLSTQITAKAGTRTYDTTLEGTIAGYDEIRNLPVASGRFLSETDDEYRLAVAVVGVDVADELFSTRNVVGNQIVVEGRTLKIIGVLEEKGSTMAGSTDSRVIIPFSLAQRLLNQKGIRTFFVTSDSPADVNAAEKALGTFMLHKYDNDPDAFNIFNQTNLLDTINESIATFTLMLGGIAGISLLVGGIGIMNIMLVSVSERTREIGIRKAIGASRTDIMVQFLIEAMSICVLGGVIGLVFAAIAMGFLEKLLTIPMGVTPAVVELAVGFSMAVGLIFGLYPANKASKLHPIEALRYE